MNFWNYITGLSTIPVQPGNTFKDHLNNLEAGGPQVINPVRTTVTPLNLVQKPAKLNLNTVELPIHMVRSRKTHLNVKILKRKKVIRKAKL